MALISSSSFWMNTGSCKDLYEVNSISFKITVSLSNVYLQSRYSFLSSSFNWGTMISRDSSFCLISMSLFAQVKSNNLCCGRLNLSRNSGTWIPIPRWQMGVLAVERILYVQCCKLDFKNRNSLSLSPWKHDYHNFRIFPMLNVTISD